VIEDIQINKSARARTEGYQSTSVQNKVFS